jgi:hypothetical protein
MVIAAVALRTVTQPSAIQEPTTNQIEIRLASGTPLEQQGRQQLERLLKRWDLSRWQFTRVVQIQSRVIPHSHPVLTLNTQYLDNDAAQLATFLHEQLHWYLIRDQAALGAAVKDMERLYPAVPEALPEGARGRNSTYLHLLVCVLEFDAVGELLGDEVARATLRGSPYYTWVYREVLERPDAIRQVLRSHGLDRPDARAAQEARR